MEPERVRTVILTQKLARLWEQMVGKWFWLARAYLFVHLPTELLIRGFVCANRLDGRSIAEILRS